MCPDAPRQPAQELYVLDRVEAVRDWGWRVLQDLLFPVSLSSTSRRTFCEGFK